MSELPADIDSLLHSERGTIPPAPPGARERVLARVHSTVGMPGAAPVPPKAAVAAAAVPAATRWIMAFLLGVGVSATVYYVARGPQSQPRPVIAEAARPALSATVIAPAVAAAPATPAPAAPVVAPSAAPVAAAATAPVAEAARIAGSARDRAAHRIHPRAGEDDLAAERGLLEKARTSLALGDPRAALDATRLHQRRFANGQLAEERESLAIRALVAAGQPAAARARADAFRGRFPGSIFRPAVDAVIQQSTP